MKIVEGIYAEIDSKNKILWLLIGNNQQLFYSFETICNFYESLNIISEIIINNELKQVVIKSANEKVWNMGGDLSFFIRCIKNREIELLREYAYKCVHCIQAISNGFESNAVIISLVQGNAFGGGFESALAADVLISLPNVKFSFPESLFGTFPGMGAYSCLTRKVGYKVAKKMISSGRKWNAEELFEKNIVDLIIESGENNVIIELLQENIFLPKDRLSKICNVPSIEELLSIVNEWITVVMNLDQKSILFMERIVNAQIEVVKN